MIWGYHGGTTIFGNTHIYIYIDDSTGLQSESYMIQIYSRNLSPFFPRNKWFRWNDPKIFANKICHRNPIEIIQAGGMLI